MAAQVPNIFVEQYDQGQKKIRADLMDENFAYVCGQLDANADIGSAAQTAADNAQTAADAAQATADGKANADLDDVTAAGKVVMAHAAMPSGQYIEMTLPATGGTVTAPADGWFYLRGEIPSGGSQKLCTVFLRKYVNGIPVIGSSSTNNVSQNSAEAILPVSQGDLVRLLYSPIGTNSFLAVRLNFVYANGSAPQS